MEVDENLYMFSPELTEIDSFLGSSKKPVSDPQRCKIPSGYSILLSGAEMIVLIAL